MDLPRQCSRRNRRRLHDDHLWLILSTCQHIKESGDVSILSAPCAYADQPDAKTDLLHHLEVSIAYTMKKRGPHGLPLIGHADWNDCLNLNCFSTEPNESFQCAGDVKGSNAESVMRNTGNPRMRNTT